MPAKHLTIETLWREMGFKLTPNQATPNSETTFTATAMHASPVICMGSMPKAHARTEAGLVKYLDDYGTELDQQEWISSELEVLPIETASEL